MVTRYFQEGLSRVYSPFLLKESRIDQYLLRLFPIHDGLTHKPRMIALKKRPISSYDKFNSKELCPRVSYRCQRKYRIICQPWSTEIEAYVDPNNKGKKNQSNADRSNKHDVRAVVGRADYQERRGLPRGSRPSTVCRCRHGKT